MQTRKSRSVLAGALVVGLGAGLGMAGPVVAASATWDVNTDPTNGFGGLTETWALTDSGTVYAEWNAFDSTSDSTPDVGSFGPAPQSVTETTGAAFLTGGGNIYSPTAATDFDIVATGYSAVADAVRTVALRVGLLGTDIDAGSVLLDGEAPTVASNTYTEALSGGFGGEENEWLFIWDSVDDRLTYQFDLSAASSSMSLDQTAFYASNASVVPIPAAAWLFGSGLLGLAGLRRGRGGGFAALRERLRLRSVDLLS